MQGLFLELEIIKYSGILGTCYRCTCYIAMEIVNFQPLQVVQFDRTLPKKMFLNECWEHFPIEPGKFFDISEVMDKSRTCNINRIYSTSTIL